MTASHAALHRPTVPFALVLALGCALLPGPASSQERERERERIAVPDLQEDESPAAASDCTFQASHGSERERWRAMSDLAERVGNATPAPPKAGGAAVGTPVKRTSNVIDAEVFYRLAADGIHPAPNASDAEIVRRLYLDLTGAPPDGDRAKAFLADTRADKRAALIDQLLSTDDFAERFTLWFGERVQNVKQSASNGLNLNAQGRDAYYRFIKDSIRAGKPYDQMVREVITGKGDQYTDGPPNYFLRQYQTNGPIQDTYDNLSAHTGERFLALQLGCLSCHGGSGHTDQINIYLSTKTRQDFWQNAAFFSRTAIAAQTDPNVANGRKYVVSDNTTGVYRLNTTSGNKSPRQPATGQPATVDPAFILTGEKPRNGEPYRDAYARMLTAHPQFARATVNYVWKELFGLGLVEPDDSFDLYRIDDAAPPPTPWAIQTLYPRLLQRLADGFVGSGYSLKWLVKTIVTSQTYQLSARYDGVWNETLVPYFARRYPKRLEAEPLFDAICVATSVPANVTVGSTNYTMTSATGLTSPASVTIPRACALPDPREGGSYANLLNTFGRGDRDTSPRTNDGAISQALSLMNDNLVTLRTRQTVTGSSVQKVLKASTDPKVIADTLFLGTLSRYPTATERDQAVTYLKSGDLTKKTEDLQFALLNRLEFLYN